MATSNLFEPLATVTRKGYVLHLDRLKSLADKIRHAAANGEPVTLEPEEVQMLAATLRLLSRSGRD